TGKQEEPTTDEAPTTAPAERPSEAEPTREDHPPEGAVEPTREDDIPENAMEPNLEPAGAAPQRHVRLDRPGEASRAGNPTVITRSMVEATWPRQASPG
nr:hypothetical protein [Acidobacteriota bacterium]